MEVYASSWTGRGLRPPPVQVPSYRKIIETTLLARGDPYEDWVVTDIAAMAAEAAVDGGWDAVLGAIRLGIRAYERTLDPSG